MSIDIPGELEWLGWVAGSDWPDGDEDDMWGIGSDWRTAAAELRKLLPDLRAAKTATIDAYPWGDGLEAMTKALDALDHGPESLEHLAEILDAVAESADGLGTEIEYTKILVISSLAMLAVEIAAAWLFPPTAPLSEALAIGATRVAVRVLGERAVSAIARFAAKTGLAALTKFAAKHVVFSTVLGAGQDLAIQAYQVGAGHRDGIDWERVGTTAYTAAAAGAVGGPAGSLLGKAANRIHPPGGRFGDAVKGAAVGAGSGIAGGLGAWGIGGFANGWTWDPRILTSAGAYGITVGGSKGFRHSPAVHGPGTRPFNAADPALHGGEASHAPVHGGDGSTPPPRTAGDNGEGPRTGEPSNTHGAEPRAGDPANPGAGESHPANAANPGAEQPRTGSHGAEEPAPQSTPRSGGPDGTTPRPQSSASGPEGHAGGENRSAPGAESNHRADTGEGPVPQGEAGPASAGTPPGQQSVLSNAHASDPLVQVRDSLRSMGVDPDGMSPRELERASTDAIMRRVGELTAAADDLPNQNLGPAEYFARRDAIQLQIADTMALRGQLRSLFEQHHAGTGPAAPAASPNPAHHPTLQPHTAPKPAAPSAPQIEPRTEIRSTGEGLDAAREKMRRLGVDPDGMSPEQMRAAAEAAFGQKADEFADRTAALEGAGLRPGEFRVQRMELQKQIDEFLGLRREIRAGLPDAGNTPGTPANTVAEPAPTPQPAPEPTAPPPVEPRTPLPVEPPPAGPEPESGVGGPGPSPRIAPEPDEFPDTTSKIPYTPRYFGLPPIPQFSAAAPPPDAIWEPPTAPEPEPTPDPTPEPVPSPRPDPIPSPKPVPTPAPHPPTPTPPTPTPTPEPPTPTPPPPTPEPPAPTPDPPSPTPEPPTPTPEPPTPTPTPEPPTPTPTPEPPTPTPPTPDPTPTPIPDPTPTPEPDPPAPYPPGPVGAG